MKPFRDGKIDVLVATDVVGRGIDVTDISHIINYDLPGRLARTTSTASAAPAAWARTAWPSRSSRRSRATS